MQTAIPEHLRDDPRVKEAESVLRTCVHCGFCLATCPTYQVLGDELDSPRGRIYQIKQAVEGKDVGALTLHHLDRCLTCRNCETTCPSGVRYAHLLDQGRSLLEERVTRPWTDRLKRSALLSVLPYRARVAPLVALGRAVRPFMPRRIARSIPPAQAVGRLPTRQHARRMLVLDGCVQPALTPATNAAARRVLDALGIQLETVAGAGCCGAMHHHLNRQAAARTLMRSNIDAWWPSIEAGAEAILVTASGCGLQVKEYGKLLADDAAYAGKAARVSELCRDPVEVLKQEDLSGFADAAAAMGPVAFHPPCSLQHGQKLPLQTEILLKRLGFTLTSIADSHLCCGSAGTYSLFQPEISDALKQRKLAAIHAGKPAIVATANIGCQVHLQQGTELRVVHWLELVDELLAGRPASA